MGFRSKMLDLLAEALCGTSWLQSRHERNMRKKHRRPCRPGAPRRTRNQVLGRHQAWPKVRDHEKPRNPGEDFNYDEKPRAIGVGIRDTARQWGEATGALLDECSEYYQKMPAEPAPVRQFSKRLRPTPVPATEAMSPSTACEVICIIGRLFDHVPYAICGQAAMAYYGSEIHRPSHVSIVVPKASQHVARCWALAQGMHAVPYKPDCFAVPTRDGLLRTVRIKIVKNSSFEAVETMRGVRSRAKIMTLPGLANQVAGAYVADLKSAASEMRQNAYARDMRWILERIADVRLDDHWLTPERVPELLKGEFWLPFTMSFPDTAALFSDAGLRIGDDDGEAGIYAGSLSEQRGGNMTGGFYTY